MKCANCKLLMNWTVYSRHIDGFTWKCNNKQCTRYQARTTIRKNSFFEKSKLPLKTWIHVLYLWSKNTSEVDLCHQVGISKNTAVDCYSFLREICKIYFDKHPIRLGGPGHIIQIEESCFSPKSKGKHISSKKQIGVFGILDIASKLSYMQIVKDRTAETLLPIIQKIVIPGSIIYADQWRAYKNLQYATAQAASHSLNFVDPETITYPHNIEPYWNKHRSKLKIMKGCHLNLFETYLYQFMWQDRFASDGFVNICTHISRIYNKI